MIGDWWDPLNVSNPGNFGKIKAPAVMWGGWYDIFQQGMVNGYDVYQHFSDPSVRGKSYLVMDPLGHCQVRGTRYI
jgi:predicted acyl esterase